MIITRKFFKKKNKVGGISLSYLKTYIAIVVKTAWYWQKSRHINQRNTIENRERDHRIGLCVALFCKKALDLESGGPHLGTRTSIHLWHGLG